MLLTLDINDFVTFFYTCNQSEKDYWNSSHGIETIYNISGVIEYSNIKATYTGKTIKRSNNVPVLNMSLGYLPAANY
jgi:hypothetical protein